jgi:hypothetical protein
LSFENYTSSEDENIPILGNGPLGKSDWYSAREEYQLFVGKGTE